MLLRKLQGNLVKQEGDNDIEFNEINKLDLTKINISDYYEAIIKNKYTTTLYGHFLRPSLLEKS